MKNVRPAFEKWEEKSPGELPYDIRHQFWARISEKSKASGNGNETEAPATLTYSSVVSRDSVRIVLTIASLNQLEILACNIQNAYLTADCREKIYVIAGPEFGSEEGKVMIVRNALCGLKTIDAAFRAHMADTFLLV